MSKTSPSDALTDADKEKLLDFLRASHGTPGAERRKITLTKKSPSEIKQVDDPTQSARTIQVEVRNKRVLVKRDTLLASEQDVLDAVEQRRLKENVALAEGAAPSTKAFGTQEAATARKARKAAGAKTRKAAAAKARDAIKEGKARKVKEAAMARAAAEAAKEREAAAKEIEDAKSQAVPSIRDAVARSVKTSIEVPARRVDSTIDAAVVQDLTDWRRKAAESEADAIRTLMSAPARTRVSEEPSEVKLNSDFGEISDAIREPTPAVLLDSDSSFGSSDIGSGQIEYVKVGRSPRPRIAFLSYRRDDSSGHAGRLHDRLTDALGEDQIFMDVDHIPPGEDFVEVIKASVWASSIMLLVIGPRWIGIASTDGRRRIDDPNDFVRLEITSALERNLKIIPVLVGGARMPLVDELPVEIGALARRQAAEVSDIRFHADSDKLIRAIKSMIEGEKAT